MDLFDPEKTKHIKQLFAVRPDFRDSRWLKDFFQSVIAAEFWGSTKKVLNGGDGFPYIALFTEKNSDAPERLSVIDVLPLATENGFGIAINPHKIQPDWVFTYGQLWSLREYGSFMLEPEELTKDDLELDEDGIYVGEPTDMLFPRYAKIALRRYLQKHHGLEEPKVMVLIDPNADPEDSLVFSVFQEEFESPEAFDAVLRAIDWHIPPHIGFRGVPKDSELSVHLKVF